MQKNHYSRVSGTPFHINGNNIINHKYNNNILSNQFMKDESKNGKNNDSGVINQLKNENRQLKMDLQQKNNLIKDYQMRVNKLEKIIQSLKNNQRRDQNQSHAFQSNHHSNTMIRPFYGNMMIGPQQFFNDFFSMNNNPQDDYYVDPVKEVEEHIIEQLYPNPDNMTYEQLLALEEEVGSVSKGLTKTQVNKLPIVSFSKYQYKKEDKCVICQYEFKNNERIRKLPCEHLFHKECVDEWLLKDKACPCCKKEVRV